MKILVIQQKMIGDVLTSSILCEAIKVKYPKSEIHYLVNSNTVPVVEGNTFIDKIILFNDKSIKGFSKTKAFAKTLKKENYDWTIDVYSKLSSNIISLFSGGKQRVSYSKWYTKWIYNHNIERFTPKDNKENLAIVNRLKLLKPLGIEANLIAPKISLSSSEIESAKELLSKNGLESSKNLVMVSILGSGANKSYPNVHMAEMLNHLSKNNNVDLLFNYIPSQLQEVTAIYNLCNEATKAKIHLDIYGKSLREFLALTSQCKALIGNEGGAVNMAKALNKPTFTIFSPWIDKNTWSLFNNTTSQIAVHLKDFKPELYKNKEEKSLKSISNELYQEFKPEYFYKQLDVFTETQIINK